MTSDSKADTLPACPECREDYTYEQGALLVCPMCGHEWTAGEGDVLAGSAHVTDAVGNVLSDGDTVSIVKSLKVKGSGSGTLKIGTKVRGIRLTDDAGDGHDIDATVPGFGRMQLKSSIVKKVI